MIRLWLSRGGSIPIREQLSAQLLLGILSRRLAPDERLPSVRDLARRLQIHANTVSAVYRDLAARGWVKARGGSGVFVNRIECQPPDDGILSFVNAWIEEGRVRGYTVQELQSELELVAQQLQPRNLLVADPDGELARILAAEIAEATGQKVAVASCDDLVRGVAPGSLVLVNSGHAPQVVAYLGHTPFHPIRLNSMQDVLAGARRPATPVLIAVVSRSQSVLSWASPLLSALGFDVESVVLRNPRDTGWQEGLTACDIVASDICAAAEFPESIQPLVFRIVADDSLAEICSLVTA
ncbi:MAG: GntR family transcriptional regulator [Bryobacteraceae bacterium]